MVLENHFLNLWNSWFLKVKIIQVFLLPPTVGKVKCKASADVDDAKPTEPLKTEYKVGDNVTYKCKEGLEKEIRQCLSDGTWSGGNFVCGREYFLFCVSVYQIYWFNTF